jgi:lysozyme family protein
MGSDMNKEHEELCVAKYGAAYFVAVQFTLEAEGLLSDHPHDAGGLTKYGITKPFLTAYMGRQATDLDIECLDITTALDAYHKLCWKGFNLDKLPLAIGGFLFDCVVNHGRFDEHLQKHLGLKPDGVYGPKTIRAIQGECADKGDERFLEELADMRHLYYAKLVQADRSQGDFIVGWTNRCLSAKRYYYAHARHARTRV